MNKFIRTPYYIIGSVLLVVSMLLTSCGAERNMKQGEKLLAVGEYFAAAEQFKQAYAKTPAKAHAQRGIAAAKMAHCYDKINFTQKATAAYRNAIRYNQGSATLRLAFARKLLKAGNYPLAEREFALVLDSLPHSELARNGLASARQAPAMKAAGSRYVVKRMDVFNSRRADYSPMLFGDNADRLYFTSTRNEATGDDVSGITGAKAGDIFVSELNDKGKWSAPEPVGGGANRNLFAKRRRVD